MPAPNLPSNIIAHCEIMNGQLRRGIVPVWATARYDRYRSFLKASSWGKALRVLVTLRNCRCKFSTAWVLSMIVRISYRYVKKVDNCGQFRCQEFTTTG